MCNAIPSPFRESSQCGIHLKMEQDIRTVYNSVRRLLNCIQVTTDTTLALYPINKTTLLKWFKNKVRHDEVEFNAGTQMCLSQSRHVVFPSRCMCQEVEDWATTTQISLPFTIFSLSRDVLIQELLHKGILSDNTCNVRNSKLRMLLPC